MNNDNLINVLNSCGKSNFINYYYIFRDNDFETANDVLKTSDLKTDESRKASYNPAKKIFHEGLDKIALIECMTSNPKKIKGGLETIIGAYQLLITEYQDNSCSEDFLLYLKNHFEIQVKSSIDQSQPASYAQSFMRMVTSHGGILPACKKLLSDTKANAGLTSLYEKGRLDLSVEVQVVKPLYQKLFTTLEIETAQNLLTAYGYQFESETFAVLDKTRVIQVEKRGTHYFADIDISVAEWRSLLADRAIFDENSLDMIEKWYKEPEYQSSSKYIMAKHKIPSKTSPFNGTVIGLGKRIVKKLNRFQVLGTTGEQTYWAILFEGWTSGDLFIWKLRNELVQAIRELGLFGDTISDREVDLTTTIILGGKVEGRKVAYYTTRYERSRSNREQAILLNGGYSCSCCGFDFEATYGEVGRDFIEVHHNKPLYSLNEPMIVNPATDLDCVCSNCHKMLHRTRENILTVQELQQTLKK